MLTFKDTIEKVGNTATDNGTRSTGKFLSIFKYKTILFF